MAHLMYARRERVDKVEEEVDDLRDTLARGNRVNAVRPVQVAQRREVRASGCRRNLIVGQRAL